MIGVKVNGVEAMQRKLRGLAAALGDTTRTNHGLSIDLYAFVTKNFQTEGGMTEAGHWEPLEPETVEWKDRRGYAMILQNTGALRQSFAPFYDREQAGVGAQQIFDEGRDPDMAAVHEFGLGHVPARPMLPTQEQALGIAMRVYGHFVTASRERSGL